MTNEQFLLLKLMEECAEVAQRASKQFQFGSEEKEPNQDKTNAVRLQDEIYDLLCIVEMLGFEATVYDSQVFRKEVKLEKYKKYSKEIGAMKIE